MKILVLLLLYTVKCVIRTVSMDTIFIIETLRDLALLNIKHPWCHILL